ncbi:hypothetical protein [Prevotella intermedia]|uniref:Uncharacterized protein n=1 Tax=Prevotella intermedia TaxID=28131 RepID=A0A0H5AZ43_PREIN|nr:hypothetical protein [Prevotella intermedia]AFJ09498.1 hypothetical protein PIN17_A0397 [Prevotella intermedia 17]APW33469.1 hypothetical protein BWX40_00565 [Prevotella intermedia]AWX08353.1 hypothetical protein CTM55_11940 [Prevotella intermedia]BAR95086.1 hypothetical protein PI172_0358 [Prevotella intermedia]BAU18544.1 conserved hypothetical protein [Prevotella intermedia]
MDRHEICISRPGLQRHYKVLVNGEIVMGGVSNKTSVETEWILTVLAVDSEQNAKIELITLDTHVLEATNEAFRELSIIANQLKKVTQTLVCTIDKRGKVLRVINSAQIADRWNQLKSEIVSMCGRTGDMTDFFNINEKLFNDQEILKLYVGQLEFFKLYFNDLYGRKLSSYEPRKTENAFKTSFLSYDMFLDHDEDSRLSRIRFKGVNFSTYKKWLSEAYGQFPFVDVQKITPQFTIEGEYLMEKENGLLKKAKLLWEEDVSKELRSHTEYIITEKHSSI